MVFIPIFTAVFTGVGLTFQNKTDTGKETVVPALMTQPEPALSVMSKELVPPV